MAYKSTEQQGEIAALAGSTEWNLLVTLTFTSARTQEQVTKALNAYFISIERRCFGRRASYERLKRLPVIEHTAEAIHVHIVMVKPENWKHKKFRDLLLAKWLKINGAGQSNLRKTDDGKSWYESIANTAEDRKKVVEYITKDVANDYSSVDFENIVI